MSRKADETATARELAHGFVPRRAQRVDIGGPADLAADGCTGIKVTVRNMSSAGFMAESAEPVRIGSFVSLDIPGLGAIEAQIRWQIGRRMGGMFLDPVTLAQCEWFADEKSAAAA